MIPGPAEILMMIISDGPSEYPSTEAVTVPPVTAAARSWCLGRCAAPGPGPGAGPGGPGPGTRDNLRPAAGSGPPPLAAGPRSTRTVVPSTPLVSHGHGGPAASPHDQRQMRPHTVTHWLPGSELPRPGRLGCPEWGRRRIADSDARLKLRDCPQSSCRV